MPQVLIQRTASFDGVDAMSKSLDVHRVIRGSASR